MNKFYIFSSVMILLSTPVQNQKKRAKLVGKKKTSKALSRSLTVLGLGVMVVKLSEMSTLTATAPHHNSSAAQTSSCVARGNGLKKVLPFSVATVVVVVVADRS